MSAFSMYTPAWQGSLYIKDSKGLATVWLSYTASLCYLPGNLEFSVISTTKTLLRNIAGDNQLLSLGTNNFEDRNVYIYPLSCDARFFTDFIGHSVQKLDYVPGIYGKFSSTQTSTSCAEMILVPECEELERRLLFMPGSIPYSRVFIVIVKYFSALEVPVEFNDETLLSSLNSPIHDQLFTCWEDKENFYSPFRTPGRSEKYIQFKANSRIENTAITSCKNLTIKLYDILKLPNVRKKLLKKFNATFKMKHLLERNNTSSVKVSVKNPKKWFHAKSSKLLSAYVSCRKLTNADFIRNWGYSKQYYDGLKITNVSHSRKLLLDLENFFEKFTNCCNLNRNIMDSFYKDRTEIMDRYGRNLEGYFSSEELKHIGYACFLHFKPRKRLLKEMRLVKVSEKNIANFGGLIILLEDKIWDYISAENSNLIHSKHIQFGLYQPALEGTLSQVRRIFHKKSLFLMHHSVFIDSRFGEFCEFVLQENQNENSVIIVMPIKTVQFVLKLVLLQKEVNRDFCTTRKNLYSLSSLIRGGWCILAPYDNVGPSSSFDTLLECAKDIHYGFGYAHKEVCVVIGHELNKLSKSTGYYKIKSL